MTHRRWLVAAVALVAAAAIALVLDQQGVDAAERCDGVRVVVDASVLGGPTSSRCAPGDPRSGLEALGRAGHAYGFVRRVPGMVCTIDARPDPCNEAPADAYWSYWSASPGGSWTYNSRGAGSRDPAPGDVEGWAFGTGAPPSIPPPSDPAPEPRPEPTAPAATGGTGSGTPSPSAGGASSAAPSSGAASGDPAPADAGPVDTDSADAGSADAGSADAGSADAGATGGTAAGAPSTQGGDGTNAPDDVDDDGPTAGGLVPGVEPPDAAQEDDAVRTEQPAQPADERDEVAAVAEPAGRSGAGAIVAVVLVAAIGAGALLQRRRRA